MAGKYVPDARIPAHYHAALMHIQAAQDELGAAARLLSPINHGGAVDWRRINRAYNAVRKLWYQLERRIPKLRREQLDAGHNGRYPCSACATVELRAGRAHDNDATMK